MEASWDRNVPLTELETTSLEADDAASMLAELAIAEMASRGATEVGLLTPGYREELK